MHLVKIQYYQEYQNRFSEQAVKGMSIIQVQSYQKFISQLEIAISEQKKHISRVSETCNSSRADWNSERQKTQVLTSAKVISSVSLSSIKSIELCNL